MGLLPANPIPYLYQLKDMKLPIEQHAGNRLENSKNTFCSITASIIVDKKWRVNPGLGEAMVRR
jgi:hypothetical protein